MNDYGRLFKRIRGFVRIFSGPYEIERAEEIQGPSILICRHDNLSGPRVVLTWLPDYVRTWVFHVFMDVETCYNHYVNYTFTQRFGWPKFIAKAAAKVLAPFVVAVLDSMQGIPVYRESIRSLRTIKATLKALYEGGTILIFPDINYISTDKKDRSVYEGFLYLERYYFNRTGKHIPFVPMFLDRKEKKIKIGQSICFADGIDFYEQKDSVLERIITGINEL
ncbi:MAG: glycerol acyltransferase [Firmicutes bacterium]|nr:glycerol acyltransferase [Bacillota bacterium]